MCAARSLEPRPSAPAVGAASPRAPVVRSRARTVEEARAAKAERERAVQAQRAAVGFGATRGGVCGRNFTRYLQLTTRRRGNTASDSDDSDGRWEARAHAHVVAVSRQLDAPAAPQATAEPPAPPPRDPHASIIFAGGPPAFLPGSRGRGADRVALAGASGRGRGRFDTRLADLNWETL